VYYSVWLAGQKLAWESFRCLERDEIDHISNNSGNNFCNVVIDDMKTITANDMETLKIDNLFTSIRTTHA